MTALPTPLDVRRGLTKASDVSYRLRWGVIGASDIASDWVKCLHEVPGAEVKAVAARSLEKATQWAAKHNVGHVHRSYEELFQDPDIDIVYISTITETHRDLTLQAIRAGKHVLCEKPLADSLLAAEEMYKAAEAKGVTLFEGMWTRFFPAMDKARQLLESGSIGDVTLVRADFPDPCYAVQAAPFAFGASALRGVSATGACTCGQTASSAMAWFDAGCAVFTFPKWDCEYPETIEIIGSKGRLSLEQWGHAPTRLVVTVTPQECLKGAGEKTSTSQCAVQPEVTTFNYPLPDPPGVPHPDWHYSNQHGFIYQAEAVHRCLATGLKECPQYTRAESLQVMRILDEIQRAEPKPLPKQPRAPLVGIILVGCGRMGKVHSESIAAIEGCCLLCVVDTLEDSATRLAEEHGVPVYAELTLALKAHPSASAVVIATPAACHKDGLLEAAAAAKHIFVEKPFTLTMEDAKACAEAIKAKGIVCQVGFMRRFDADTAKAQSLVADGKVGKVQMVRVRSFDGMKSSDSYYRTSGGMFLDMSCHDLDLICFLAQDRPTHVSVMGSVTVNPTFETFGDIDTAVISIRFASGAVGWIENLRFCPAGYDTQIEIVGTEGSVKVGPISRSGMQHSSADGVNSGPLVGHHARYEPTFREELECFVQSCRTGVLDPRACGLHDGLTNLSAVRACQQARQEGRTVEVPRVSA